MRFAHGWINNKQYFDNFTGRGDYALIHSLKVIEDKVRFEDFPIPNKNTEAPYYVQFKDEDIISYIDEMGYSDFNMFDCKYEANISENHSGKNYSVGDILYISDKDINIESEITFELKLEVLSVNSRNDNSVTKVKIINYSTFESILNSIGSDLANTFESKIFKTHKRREIIVTEEDEECNKSCGGGGKFDLKYCVSIESTNQKKICKKPEGNFVCINPSFNCKSYKNGEKPVKHMDDVNPTNPTTIIDNSLRVYFTKKNRINYGWNEPDENSNFQRIKKKNREGVEETVEQPQEIDKDKNKIILYLIIICIVIICLAFLIYLIIRK